MFVPDGLGELLGGAATLAALLQSVLELVQPAFAVGDLAFEGLLIGDEDLSELLGGRGVLEAADVNVFGLGDQADGGLHPCVLAFQLTHSGVEDPVVCAETVPDEVAVVIAAEPVDAEDRRGLWRLVGQVQPLLRVVADIERDEGAVRHGIVARFLADCGCGWLAELAQGVVDGLVPGAGAADERMQLA